jgi:hypothetical protein
MSLLQFEIDRRLLYPTIMLVNMLASYNTQFRMPIFQHNVAYTKIYSNCTDILAFENVFLACYFL